MNYSRRVTLTTSLMLAVCLLGSAFSLHRLNQLGTGVTEDVLFIRSPKVLKRLSLGYDGLLADVYWTRAVQYFGARHAARASHYRLLSPLLAIATTLDPQLIVAYHFGANFLSPKPPDGAGMPDDAVRLAEFGIAHNPNDWKLYYELGFIYYIDMKDYAKAAEAFARGGQVPNAHPFLRTLAAEMARHAGDTKMARALWTTTFQINEDPQIRSNALAHLRALQVADDVTALQELVAQYGKKTGELPKSMTDLASAKLLQAIPVDPTGRPYKVTADGLVVVEAPDQIPFLEKGARPGYQPPKAQNLEGLAH